MDINGLYNISVIQLATSIMPSTTTLLVAVNRVLLDVGERQSSTLSSTPAAVKATAYIQEAYEDIQHLQDWSWQRDIFVATSWNAEQATFSGLKRINNVVWFDDFTKQAIPNVTHEQFYAIEALSSFTDKSNRPAYYCTVDTDTIAINPYPTDVTGRSRLKVNGYRLFPSPTTSTSLFDCPEEFVNTIIKKATVMMLMRHLGETDEAQILQRDFELKMRYLIAKDRGASVLNHTMYRRF